MPTQTTSIFIVLFANGNVDVDSDCDASVGSRIFDIGLVCSDSVPAKTSQWLATLADTRTHTLRQTPRIIVHVYFVCALIFFSLRCDADNATYAQRVANTMRTAAAAAAASATASHTRLISFMHKRCQLCLQMQQSRQAAFLFVCSAQFFSPFAGEGGIGKRGAQSLPC